MGKLLFWIALIFLVLIVVRMLGRSVAAIQARHAPISKRKPTQAAQPPSEIMVRCAHCGMYLPRSEALQMGGKTWCTPEHVHVGDNKG